MQLNLILKFIFCHLTSSITDCDVLSVFFILLERFLLFNFLICLPYKVFEIHVHLIQVLETFLPSVSDNNALEIDLLFGFFVFLEDFLTLLLLGLFRLVSQLGLFEEISVLDFALKGSVHPCKYLSRQSISLSIVFAKTSFINLGFDLGKCQELSLFGDFLTLLLQFLSEWRELFL